MMDRLDEIKRHFQKSRNFGGMTTDAEKWLIAEVERLRKDRDEWREASNLWESDYIKAYDKYIAEAAEVRRLRKVEDAACQLLITFSSRGNVPGDFPTCEISAAMADLFDVMDANPPPESG